MIPTYSKLCIGESYLQSHTWCRQKLLARKRISNCWRSFNWTKKRIGVWALISIVEPVVRTRPRICRDLAKSQDVFVQHLWLPYLATLGRELSAMGGCRVAERMTLSNCSNKQYEKFAIQNGVRYLEQPPPCVYPKKNKIKQIDFYRVCYWSTIPALTEISLPTAYRSKFYPLRTLRTKSPTTPALN